MNDVINTILATLALAYFYGAIHFGPAVFMSKESKTAGFFAVIFWPCHMRTIIIPTLSKEISNEKKGITILS